MSAVSKPKPKIPRNIKYNEIKSSLYETLCLLAMARDNPILLLGHRAEAILAPDMFDPLKRNTCYQVIYMLLQILAPNKCEENTLPQPFDKKLENTFRNNTKDIINNLYKTYPSARIPVVETTHMVSVENNRIIYILWRVSELAMLQHLVQAEGKSDDGSVTLLPFTYNKNTKVMENVKKLIEFEINTSIKSNRQQLKDIMDCETRAKQVIDALSAINKTIGDLKPCTVQLNTDTEANDARTQYLHKMNSLNQCRRNIIHIMVELKRHNEVVYTGDTELDLMQFLRTVRDQLKAIVCHMQQLDVPIDCDAHNMLLDVTTAGLHTLNEHNGTLQSLLENLKEKIGTYDEKLPAVVNNSAYNIFLDTTPLNTLSQFDKSAKLSLNSIQSLERTARKKPTLMQLMSSVKRNKFSSLAGPSDKNVRSISEAMASPVNISKELLQLIESDSDD